MKKTVKKKFTFLLIIFIVLSISFTTIGQERNLRLFKELFDETDETGKNPLTSSTIILNLYLIFFRDFLSSEESGNSIYFNE